MHQDIEVRQSKKIRRFPAIVSGCLQSLSRIFLRNLTPRRVIGTNDTDIDSVVLELPGDLWRNSGICKCKVDIRTSGKAYHAVVAEFRRVGEDIGFVSNADHRVFHLGIQGIGRAVSVRQTDSGCPHECSIDVKALQILDTHRAD